MVHPRKTAQCEVRHITLKWATFLAILFYYCNYQLNSRLIVNPSNIEVTNVRRSVNQSS